MIFRFAILLFMFAIPAPCFAQSSLPRVEQLEDEDLDVYDIFIITEIAFVTKRDSVLDTKKGQANLAKQMTPLEAIKRGMPNQPTVKLIDRLLRTRHKPCFRKATVTDLGDHGFYWNLKYDLFPTTGGGSGIPYEYHAIVRSDGTPAQPELHFCDSYGLGFYSEETMLSALAFDDLLSTTQAKINENEIKNAAEKAFNIAISTFNITEKFQALAPQRQTFSSKLTSKGGEGEGEVWAVRFVDASIKNPKSVRSGNSIVVWVTSDLKTSKLTFGYWDTKSIRKQPNAK